MPLWDLLVGPDKLLSHVDNKLLIEANGLEVILG